MSYTKLARLDELPEGALIELVQGKELYVFAAPCRLAKSHTPGDARRQSQSKASSAAADSKPG
jgi:hypothetical protein